MSVASERARATGMPLRYLLVFWLLALSAVAYLDRTNISIAGVQIVRAFHIDNTHLGWIFSSFLIGYASFQIPGGILAQRLGPRRVLFYGLLWWGLFTTLTTLVPPRMRGAVLVLVLVRFALGAGEAVLYPASNQFVERWFPVQELGKANGLIFAGVGLGAGLTPPLVTAIILLYGWRAPFWFSAAIGVVVGVVWYVAARDTPEGHPWISAAEMALVREGRGAPSKDAAELPGSGHGMPWAKIFSSKEAWILTGSYFAFCYSTWIFFGWFYIYLVQARGLSLKTSAAYATMPFVAMTVGCLSGGVLSDWLVRRYSRRVGRCWLSTLAMATTALLLAVGSRVHDPWLASVILALSMGVLYVSANCFWAMTADFAGRHAGVASGLMNMGGQAGGAVAASLTPLVAAHFGWKASFMIAVILVIVGGLAWIGVDPESRLSTAESAA